MLPLQSLPRMQLKGMNDEHTKDTQVLHFLKQELPEVASLWCKSVGESHLFHSL